MPAMFSHRNFVSDLLSKPFLHPSPICSASASFLIVLIYLGRTMKFVCLLNVTDCVFVNATRTSLRFFRIVLVVLPDLRLSFVSPSVKPVLLLSMALVFSRSRLGPSHDPR